MVSAASVVSINNSLCLCILSIIPYKKGIHEFETNIIQKEVITTYSIDIAHPISASSISSVLQDAKIHQKCHFLTVNYDTF